MYLVLSPNEGEYNTHIIVGIALEYDTDNIMTDSEMGVASQRNTQDIRFKISVQDVVDPSTTLVVFDDHQVAIRHMEEARAKGSKLERRGRNCKYACFCRHCYWARITVIRTKTVLATSIIHFQHQNI